MSETTVTLPPPGLGERGRRFWGDILTGYPQMAGKPAELLLLEEACRIADRLEKLDELLRGEVDTWATLRLPKGDGDTLTLQIDGALAEARQQENQLKQLIAAMRLPDEATGRRPQQRGGARGAYASTAAKAGSVVSSLDRARARAKA